MADMKTLTINKLITLTRNFCAATWADSILGYDAKKISVQMDIMADDLHENYGMDWDEIEAIEIDTMKKAPH